MIRHSPRQRRFRRRNETHPTVQLCNPTVQKKTLKMNEQHRPSELQPPTLLTAIYKSANPTSTPYTATSQTTSPYHSTPSSRSTLLIHTHNPPSNTPRTSSTALKSAKNGTRSVSSVSCGSLNHDDTGTALFGWKIYDAGELSKIMVSAIGRPSWDRSYGALTTRMRQRDNEQKEARERETGWRWRQTLT
jgi:hypothetical protein